MSAVRRRLLLIAAGVLAAGGVPVGVGRAQPGRPPLRVVASFSILADLAREVGGAEVDVHALVGPDADAHVFQPTPADARRIAQADLVIVNGLGFEGWIERLVKSAGYRGPVIVASEGVVPRPLDAGHGEAASDDRQHGHGHAHGHGVDPHAWQDLRNVRRYVANLRDAFALARPQAAAVFAERARQYDARLAALDQSIRAQFAALPPQRRRVLTSHDAFGYFGAAYGLTLLAPQGVSTEAEPSAAAVARLITEIRQRQVGAVFMENISSPRLIERIAREAGVAVGGRLYSDALSAPGTEADSYLKLFAHNAQTIAAALAQAR